MIFPFGRLYNANPTFKRTFCYGMFGYKLLYLCFSKYIHHFQITGQRYEKLIHLLINLVNFFRHFQLLTLFFIIKSSITYAPKLSSRHRVLRNTMYLRSKAWYILRDTNVLRCMPCKSNIKVFFFW